MLQNTHHDRYQRLKDCPSWLPQPCQARRHRLQQWHRNHVLHQEPFLMHFPNQGLSSCIYQEDEEWLRYLFQIWIYILHQSAPPWFPRCFQWFHCELLLLSCPCSSEGGNWSCLDLHEWPILHGLFQNCLPCPLNRAFCPLPWFCLHLS